MRINISYKPVAYVTNIYVDQLYLVQNIVEHKEDLPLLPYI